MGNAVRRGSALSRPTRYEDDIYGWAQEQAELLRAGQFARIDVRNLAEEIEDVGRSEYRALESALAIVLLHMLKWDLQSGKRSRSWALSIAEHRNRIAVTLRDSPGLKAKREQAVADAYATARLRAADETGLALGEFAQESPYGWDEIVSRPVEISPQ